MVLMKKVKETIGGQRMKFLGYWMMIFLRLNPGIRSCIIMKLTCQTGLWLNSCQHLMIFGQRIYIYMCVCVCVCVCLFFFFVFCPFRAAPTAYVGSQARGPMVAIAGSLRHSHGNAGSLTHWARPGIEPATSWFLVGFISTAPRQELRECILLKINFPCKNLHRNVHSVIIHNGQISGNADVYQLMNGQTWCVYGMVIECYLAVKGMKYWSMLQYGCTLETC